MVSDKGQACLVTVFHHRDTGLLALSPGPGLAGRGEPESVDIAVKDGVGPGRKSNLPDPLELIFSPLY